MRKLTAILSVAVLASCGSGEMDESAMEDMAEETPVAAMTLADFAGSWSMSAAVDGTEEPVLTTMNGSADSSEWMLSLPDREDVPMQVSMMGDSLIGVTEQYESVLREGVMVTVRTALALVDGEVHGTLQATYQMEEGEEIVNGMMHGTRNMN